ncbi:MAG: FAD-dependent oxidoreductase [Firmicutes bacterium]|nr:FAD-dependent oxidoreductase [Bacillota bacterium]HPU00827.1 FAD-dependent oxidoreductase [Bacillota bacterium]
MTHHYTQGSKNNVIPPCQAACPLHQDVRDYLFAIATGDFDRALEIIKETNPLPSICGTICAHHCEDECRRNDVDRPLSIRGLKRFAVENSSVKVPPSGIERGSKGKVAVIGGGPSGLTAAYDLARQGCAVTVYDREPAMGGAVRHYIPLYRLPDEVIDRDVAEIAEQGVEFKTGYELGRNLSLDDLEKEGYKAILIALGLPVSRGLDIPGVEGEGIYYALDFLKRVKRDAFRFEGNPTVIVVGGGNVAMDVARSAVRCGAGSVKVVCLESSEEMPAFPWEIEEAKEEKVEFYNCWGPRAVIRENGKITGLELIECCSVFDEAGRFCPVYNEECKNFITGDVIIFAIGQAGDPKPLQGQLELDERGRLVFDRKTMSTSRPGVFACGEMITGPGTAVQAMRSGRLAAQAILAYLEGREFNSEALEEPAALEKLDAAVAEKITRVGRHPLPMVPPAERVKHFQQVEHGYDAATAICEARRCLTCIAGAERIDELCANCLTCVRVCPYDVPVINEEGTVSIRSEQCQACGLCLSICPAYAIKFRTPMVEEAAAAIEPAAKGLLERAGSGPAVLLITCGYGPFALPGIKGFKADSMALVRYPCVAKIDTVHLLKAVEAGVDGIIVVGCKEEEPSTCPHKDAAGWIRKRIAHVNALLEEMGLGDNRIAYLELSFAEAGDFGRIMAEAAEQFKELSPSPLR